MSFSNTYPKHTFVDQLLVELCYVWMSCGLYLKIKQTAGQVESNLIGPIWQRPLLSLFETGDPHCVLLDIYILEQTTNKQQQKNKLETNK